MVMREKCPARVIRRDVLKRGVLVARMGVKAGAERGEESFPGIQVVRLRGLPAGGDWERLSRDGHSVPGPAQAVFDDAEGAVVDEPHGQGVGRR